MDTAGNAARMDSTGKSAKDSYRNESNAIATSDRKYSHPADPDVEDGSETFCSSNRRCCVVFSSDTLLLCPSEQQCASSAEEVRHHPRARQAHGGGGVAYRLHVNMCSCMYPRDNIFSYVIHDYYPYIRRSEHAVDRYKPLRAPQSFQLTRLNSSSVAWISLYLFLDAFNTRAFGRLRCTAVPGKRCKHSPSKAVRPRSDRRVETVSVRYECSTGQAAGSQTGANTAYYHALIACVLCVQAVPLRTFTRNVSLFCKLVKNELSISYYR